MKQLGFTGFNGFGQFGSDIGHNATYFKVLSDVGSSDAENLLIAFSWRFTAYAHGKNLWLVGLLKHRPHENVKVTTIDNVEQLAACDRFCLILLKNGRIFKLLPHVDAVLEEVKLELTDDTICSQKRNIFGERKSSNSIIVTHIACGSNIVAAVSNCNKVYSIPSQIYQFERSMRVRQLLCGFEHALLLNGNGDVYTWGNGLRGQLGKDILHLEETPTLIEALAGVKITYVAAGGWHSSAISAFGDLYVWGWNINGQLGLPIFKIINGDNLKQPTVYPLPQVLDLPNCCETSNCEPLRVFAGGRHTILQMDCGSLFASGWNGHGQLGIVADVQYCDTFRKLNKIVENTTDIICGSWCTVLVE